MDLARRLMKPPALMVVVALIFKLALIAALHTYHIDSAQDHFLFAHETGRVARSIASGQGFSSPFHGATGPTAIPPPLFPYLLASIFRLFSIYSDASAFVVLALSSLFSALTCLTVFYLGKKTFGLTTANLAGWTWAFLPTTMLLSVRRVEVAPLTALLLSLTLLLTLCLEFPARNRDWFAFGLVCGLTSLANPGALSVLPFLWGWLWFRLRGRVERPSRLVGMAVLAFLATVSPWLVRNYITFHRVSPLRSNFGLELHLGNNPEAFGSPVSALSPAYNAAEMAKYQRMGEVAYMDEKKHEALQFIEEHPDAFSRLTLLRISYWWSSNWQIRGIGWRAKWAAAGIWFGFAMESFLALLGLVLALRNRKWEVVPSGILLAVYPLTYYVVYYQLRYRHPLEPVIIVLCVYALQQLASKQRAVAPAAVRAAQADE